MFSFNFFKNLKTKSCKICRCNCLGNKGSCYKRQGDSVQKNNINLIILKRSNSQIQLCDNCLGRYEDLNKIVELILKEKNIYS